MLDVQLAARFARYAPGSCIVMHPGAVLALTPVLPLLVTERAFRRAGTAAGDGCTQKSGAAPPILQVGACLAWVRMAFRPGRRERIHEISQSKNLIPAPSPASPARTASARLRR